jgi:hypothetical protein
MLPETKIKRLGEVNELFIVLILRKEGLGCLKRSLVEES